MKLPLVFLVVLTQALADDSSEEKINCEGGICMPKYLCPEGSYINSTEPLRNLVSIRLGDDDDCVHYMKICCKNINRNNDNVGTVTEAPLSEDDFEEPPSSCGQANANGLVFNLTDPDGKNSVTQFGEFPWVAAILTTTEEGEALNYQFAGSLIHPKVVLTAAHSVENSAPQDYIVRLGEWDFETTLEPFKHQDIAIQSMISHPLYDKPNLKNDIALLVLQKPATLGQHIRTICLPQATDLFFSHRCIANGWGKQNEVYANIMKKIILEIVSRATCKTQLRIKMRNPFFSLDKSVLCAGGEEGIDTCEGDGGAPLFCNVDGSYVQAGIVSWGLSCGEKNVPAVYVDVAKYVEWIQQEVQKIS